VFFSEVARENLPVLEIVLRRPGAACLGPYRERSIAVKKKRAAENEIAASLVDRCRRPSLYVPPARTTKPRTVRSWAVAALDR